MLSPGQLVKRKTENDDVLFRMPFSEELAGVFIEDVVQYDTYLVLKVESVSSPFNTGRTFHYVKLLSMKSNSTVTYQSFDDPELDLEIISNG